MRTSFYRPSSLATYCWSTTNTQNTDLVVALDIGKAGLLPRLKRLIGERLAEPAQAQISRQNVKYASPLDRSARTEDTTVVVASLSVTEPVAVRDARKSDPDVNLYGKNGLPAGPFRTDSFDLPYPHKEQ